MKKIAALLLLGVVLITIQACTQDFDVSADYKEVPVVYGLLSSNENVHYIRIQKGFLIDGDAFPAAGVADSVYYSDSLVVTLKELPNGGTFTLTRVDGNTEVPAIPKDGGQFANSPNILYKFTGSLNPSKEYQLTVVRGETNDVITTAKTKLVSDFTISFPEAGSKFDLKTVQVPIVYWFTAGNAGIYDLTIRFNYLEFANGTTGPPVKDTFVDIVILKNNIFGNGSPADPRTTELNGEYILRAIAAGIPANDAVYREFNETKGMQFRFGAGGIELANYINSKLAQSGITSNEALPPYTNIQNGVGLLSSRYFKNVDGVLLGDKGLDTLSCSPITSGLKFKNSLGGFCF